MATMSHAGQTAQYEAVSNWGRADAALLSLATATLALVTVQFALAGLGAFTMVKTPTDSAYGAHMVLGVIIGVLCWLTAAAALTSRAARLHRPTAGRAVTLALLAIPVEPLLGDAGQHAPAIGALHALTGLAIFALAGWLTSETARRRSASRHAAAEPATRPGAPKPLETPTPLGAASSLGTPSPPGGDPALGTGPVPGDRDCGGTVRGDTASGGRASGGRASDGRASGGGPR